MSERFLVTGALGCIGAWTVARLVSEGVPVVAFDAGPDPYRLRYLLDDEALEAVTLVRGDITAPDALRRTILEHGITNLIHLAALQVPACQADPVAGALVNVVGTVNAFEAIRGTPAAERPLVYASSVAAYDDVDDGAPASPDPSGRPGTHYGVFKRANEGNAWVFHREQGIASVGLRPYVVYGVGRDQGLTSSPTWAMQAAALGRPYRIAYGGRSHLQYADDVAAAFIAASRSGHGGADVLNLGGSVVDMHEVVAAIERSVPELAGLVEVDGSTSLPFPDEVDASAVAEVLGPLPVTSLEDAVDATISRFRDLLAAGRMTAPPAAMPA
jgi:nucleoside-diphosphate-sugar epimerase